MTSREDFVKRYSALFPAVKWLDVTKTYRDVRQWSESLARNPGVMLVAFDGDYVTLLNHRGAVKVNIYDASESMIELVHLISQDSLCSACLSDIAANYFSLYYCCPHCRYALCMRCVSNVDVRKDVCHCGVGKLACSYEPVEVCGLKARPNFFDRLLSVVRAC
jgi:hypothetical protein